MYVISYFKYHPLHSSRHFRISLGLVVHFEIMIIQVIICMINADSSRIKLPISKSKLKFAISNLILVHVNISQIKIHLSKIKVDISKIKKGLFKNNVNIKENICTLSMDKSNISIQIKQIGYKQKPEETYQILEKINGTTKTLKCNKHKRQYTKLYTGHLKKQF